MFSRSFLKQKTLIVILLLAVSFLFGATSEAATKNTTSSFYKEAVALNKKGKIYQASYKFSQFMDSADTNNDATNEMLIAAASIFGSTGKMYQVGRALDKVDETKLNKPEMICSYYKMKALLSLKDDDSDSALSFADKVIAVKNKKCDSDIAIAHFIKSDILKKQGDSDSSVVELGLGIKSFSKNVDYINLGLILNNFDTVLARYQKTPFGLVYTGDLYYSLGLYKKAEKSYLEAVKKDKDFLPAYMSLAELYDATNDATNTMKYYKLALKIDPEYYRALNGAGFAYYTNFNAHNITQEELSAAIDYLNKSLKEDPTYYRAYNNLGLVYKNLGQYSLAKQNFLLSISSSEHAEVVGYWKPYFNLGVLYEQQNNFDAASEYYLKAIAVAPSERYLNSMVSEFYYDNAKYSQAIIYFDRAVKLGTIDEGTLQRFADSYYRLNQLDEARALSEKILLHYPNSKGTMIMLAFIYDDLGMTKEANDMREKAGLLADENQ